MLSRPLSAIAAAALTLATVAAASSAQAQDLGERSVSVSFADLDLNRPSGVARLETRLKYAARQVCDSGSRDLRSRQLEQECLSDVLAGARTQVAAIVDGRGARSELALRR